MKKVLCMTLMVFSVNWCMGDVDPAVPKVHQDIEGIDQKVIDSGAKSCLDEFGITRYVVWRRLVNGLTGVLPAEVKNPRMFVEIANRGGDKYWLVKYIKVATTDIDNQCKKIVERSRIYLRNPFAFSKIKFGGAAGTVTVWDALRSCLLSYGDLKVLLRRDYTNRAERDSLDPLFPLLKEKGRLSSYYYSDENYLGTLYQVQKSYFSKAKVVEEIQKASRKANSKEQKGVKKLLAILEKANIHIDASDVRFFDSKSLIDYFQGKDKVKKQSVTVVEFLDNYADVDKDIKGSVEKDLNNNSKSTVYKDMLSALAVKVQSKQFVDNVVGITDNKKRKIKFVPSTSFFSFNNIINVSQKESDKTEYMISGFAGKDALEVGPGMYAYQDKDNSYALFHELGGLLTGGFGLVARSLELDDSMHLMSAISNITASSKLKDKLIVGQQASQDEKTRWVQQVNIDYGQEFTTYDSAKSYITTLCSSKTGLAKIMFKDNLETFQTFGVGLLKQNGKYILCINSLSDFALSVEKGDPVRINSKDLKTVKSKPDISFVLHKEFYQAMFEIYGGNFENYEKKLQK